MSAIEQIVVRCKEQEDWTGSDDLDFYVDGVFLGRLTISSGDKKTVIGPGLIIGDAILIEPGQTLTIKEHDVDPDDLILSYTVKEEDLDSTITLSDSSSSADYTFEITLVGF